MFLGYYSSEYYFFSTEWRRTMEGPRTIARQLASCDVLTVLKECALSMDCCEQASSIGRFLDSLFITLCTDSSNQMLKQTTRQTWPATSPGCARIVHLTSSKKGCSILNNNKSTTCVSLPIRRNIRIAPRACVF